MLFPVVHGGHSVSAIILDITSNTSHYNILTEATAAGYDASTDSTAIIVNVAAAITASSAAAMRTGALNAASDLTINVASGAAITGFTGAVGGAGAVGSAGGDGILFEISSGTGTYLVDNDGVVSGGGGGGGGGGVSGIRGNLVYDDACKCNVCSGAVYGSNGSDGSAGGLGQAGSAGGSGSYGGGSASCNTRSPGGGGAGGAAGFSVRKSSLTVGTSGSGTFNGTAG